ncbi:DNA replication regulator SLD2 [Coniochaeta sp. 2T2.1]|nr:DNA replication regulator SLD2 [Coniochaeta sp. 2T2.1]
MDDTTRAEYESKSQALRAELKQWETSWAKTHDGKKPSRDDIKNNPDIGQKYKSYQKLSDILKGKLPPPSKSTTSSPSRKRKSSSSAPAPAPTYTPSKRLRTTPSISRTALLPNNQTTPSLNRKLFFSPASAKVPTPTSIGPTPQRDGKVLGLFDLLPEETPSRPRTGDFIADEPLLPHDLAATPRKNPSDNDPRSGSTTTPAHRHDRTPMSTGKRTRLDNFMFYTPLKNRDGNAGTSFAARIGISGTKTTDKENGLVATTPKGPQSASRSLFATPAFLKRGYKPLDPVDETGEEEVRPLRLPRKPLARGLSSIAAGLRKLEEEKLDDEMEAMREMEEGYMPPPAKKQKVVDDNRTDLEREAQDGFPVVEVEDSQVHAQDKPVLLGGFDDESLLDSDIEEQLDRGQPLRVYQKKGQKRTTRRHNMKPTRSKRPTTNPDEEADSDEEVVPETQLNAPAAPDGEVEDDYNLLSGSDFDDDEDAPKKKKAVKKAKEKRKDADKGEEKEGVVKKAVRKVKATANANFKRLKLKNYGAKGGPGVNSRFRRRR